MLRVAGPVPKLFSALAFCVALSACVPDPSLVSSGATKVPPAALAAETYAAKKDANFVIPALPVEQIPEPFRRQAVAFQTDQPVGTIIINPAQKVLHYVTGKGRAIRYGIAVGAEGFQWSGEAIINEKKQWPTWTPPKEMIARKPELAKWEKGQPGGPTNPLGARAIYLTTNGVDYGYRIHGTPEWQSIGRNASSGCIRMINQDVMDLYTRVQGGEKVIVLTASGEIPKGLTLPPPAPVKKVAAKAAPKPAAPIAVPALPTLPQPAIALGSALGSAPALPTPAAAAPAVAPAVAPPPVPAPALAAPAVCAVPLVNGACPATN